MRILIVRIGAYGDVLITTPLIRHLKESGNEIYYLGSEQAVEILKNNKNIDKFIFHKRDSVENEKLGEYFEMVKIKHECNQIMNLCESIEVRLALSESYPQWNWPKKERFALCNKNYYEYTFEHVGLEVPGGYNLRPEMFFDSEEDDFIMQERKKMIGYKVIMWGLSGSGRNKTYPYVPYIVSDILKEFNKVIFVLVGGNTCKILECGFPKHHRIIKKCGEYNIRQSILMSKYVDLVISPDTGFLHGAGCFDVPKIGILTHTTRENITKHFINDYSLESEANCAPCFRLINEADFQCTIENETKACMCMSADGMKPEKVYNKIKMVLNGMGCN